MDFGWAELLVIGVVALIVIGPKDLPEMFRTLGRFTAKARSMAREFSRAMEQAAKDSGVNDVAKDLKAVTSPKAMGLDAVKSAADKFEKWDPLKNAAKPSSPAPVRPATTPAAGAVADLPPVSPAEAAERAAAAVSPTPAAAMPGPATAALAEKQAQRKAIAQEAAAKLRAVSAGPSEAAAPTAPAVAAKPPRKPRAKKADAPVKSDGE